MIWRVTPDEAKRTDATSRKAAFMRRVTQGVPVGILGYVDEKPIARCSIALHETYRDLGRVPEKSGGCHTVTRLFFAKNLSQTR